MTHRLIDSAEQAGVYIGGGDGDDAADGDDQAAVAFDAFDMSLGTFEGAAGDHHAVALMVFGSVVAQQREALASSTDDETEHFHLTVGNHGSLSALGVVVYPCLSMVVHNKMSHVGLAAVQKKQ